MEECYAKKLAILLDEFRDIFRTKLGANAPAWMPPMEINLKPDAKPVYASKSAATRRRRQRSYATKRMNFSA